MIPILFSPNAKEFNNNGIGVLIDTASCIVTEERNGEYELEMQYPVNGKFYSNIAVDCQILAKPNETSSLQAFRIYRISKPMMGIVTINAEHISYRLSNVLVNAFASSSITNVFSKLKSEAINDNPFNFWTDKTSTTRYETFKPASIRSLLGGNENSILDVYGGEYEFDNYTVKLHESRGRDNGVVIAYAKNLTGVVCDERLDGVVTGVIAYWQGTDENGISQEIRSDLAKIDTDLSYSRDIAVDCSSVFDTKPEKSYLNQLAEKYLNDYKNTPYVSVSVQFVNLGDTEEYKQYKNLERVRLCDIVTVIHPTYDIRISAKVVKTVYNVLKEKYEKIEIGTQKTNITQTIAKQETEITNTVSVTMLQQAVNQATQSITGNSGGYIVLDPPKNPQRLLVMDKPNIGEAVKVWQWNLGGLGFSGTGANGEYRTAITQDGQIVADFITAGKLNANIIQSGVINAVDGMSYFDLDASRLFIGTQSYGTAIENGEITQFFVAGLHEEKIGGLRPIAPQGNSELLFYRQGYAQNVSLGVQYTEGEYSGGYGILASFSLDVTTIDSKMISISSHGSVATLTSDEMVVIGNGITWSEGLYLRDPNVCIRDNLLISGDAEVWNLYVLEKLTATQGVSSAEFINSSDRKIKKNIKPNTKKSLADVNSLKIYDYQLKSNNKNVKMGLMADEAPADILSDDGKGINLYSYCGMLAKAIQELSAKVDDIEKR